MKQYLCFRFRNGQVTRKKQCEQCVTAHAHKEAVINNVNPSSLFFRATQQENRGISRVYRCFPWNREIHSFTYRLVLFKLGQAMLQMMKIMRSRIQETGISFAVKAEGNKKTTMWQYFVTAPSTPFPLPLLSTITHHPFQNSATPSHHLALYIQ